MENNLNLKNVLKERYNYFADYMRLWEKQIELIKESAGLPRFERKEVRPGSGVFALNYSEPIFGEMRLYNLAEKAEGDKVIKGYLDLAENFHEGEYNCQDPLTRFYKGEISFNEFPEDAIPTDDEDFGRFMNFVENVVTDAMAVMRDRLRRQGVVCNVDDAFNKKFDEIMDYAEKVADGKRQDADWARYLGI